MLFLVHIIDGMMWLSRDTIGAKFWNAVARQEDNGIDSRQVTEVSVKC